MLCTNSLCATSRATIITGLYSHQTGAYTLREDLNTGTIPSVLNGDEDQAAYKAQTLKQLDPEVLDLALQKKLWPGEGWETEFAQVSCPALLLQSDTACGGVMDEDLNAIEELKAENWTWKRFEGLGHSIHYERTEEYCELLRSFFQK